MPRSLTQDRLKELLDYDPETGCFRWKSSARTKRPVRPFGAGCLSRAGYIVLRVDQKLFAAHRLAWLYVNGDWPSQDLDHIDGNRANNSFANLRLAAQTENQQNRKAAKRDSRSGFLGVSPDKKRWKAEIQVNKQRQRLGNFDTPEEAHTAYLEAKRRLHPFGNI